MAVYKVPQDVEAEDKILGPFSFRQFIYLSITAAAIGVAVLLFKLIPILVVVPIPVVLLFGALALPIRKDQPMEMYLAAIINFYIKPRMHYWDPDGIESLVRITVPKNNEPERAKNISQMEAGQRLRYLSEISDSRGWSVRGVAGPLNTPMNEDVFNEAQQTSDMLDNDSSVARNFDQMIETDRNERHVAMLNQFKAAAMQNQVDQPVKPTQATPRSENAATEPNAPVSPSTESITYNPYPTSMNQSVISPISDQQNTSPAPADNTATPTPEPVINTSHQAVSPDILKLANNSDLSVETLAREAERLNKKKESDAQGEIYISLR